MGRLGFEHVRKTVIFACNKILFWSDAEEAGYLPRVKTFILDRKFLVQASSLNLNRRRSEDSVQNYSKVNR